MKSPQNLNKLTKIAGASVLILILTISAPLAADPDMQYGGSPIPPLDSASKQQDLLLLGFWRTHTIHV